MNYHPVANIKIFFTRTKISITWKTQVGEVAASQKLLNFQFAITITLSSAVCDTVKTSRKLYMLT